MMTIKLNVFSVFRIHASYVKAMPRFISFNQGYGLKELVVIHVILVLFYIIIKKTQILITLYYFIVFKENDIL